MADNRQVQKLSKSLIRRLSKKPMAFRRKDIRLPIKDRPVRMVITPLWANDEFMAAIGKVLGKAYWYRPKAEMNRNMMSLLYNTPNGDRRIWFGITGFGDRYRLRDSNGDIKCVGLYGTCCRIRWYADPYWDCIMRQAFARTGMLWADKSVFEFIPGVSKGCDVSSLIEKLDIRDKWGGTFRYD